MTPRTRLRKPAIVKARIGKRERALRDAKQAVEDMIEQRARRIYELQGSPGSPAWARQTSLDRIRQIARAKVAPVYDQALAMEQESAKTLGTKRSGQWLECAGLSPQV